MRATTVLWFLVFTGFGINYMTRNNLNIAIVAMVHKQNASVSANGEVTGIYNETTLNTTRRSIFFSGKVFNWDESEQGLVLSSYFWLHWMTEVPGGVLSHRYGTKVIFGTANFIGVLLTLLTPSAAYYGYEGLVTLRVCHGFVAGVVWPSMHTMMAKWIPQKDRGKFISSYLGSSVGIAFTYFTSGYLIDFLSWEYVFYVTGLIGLVWSLLWMLLAYETPEEHPRISDEEREYIVKGVGNTLTKEKLPIPWKAMLTSYQVWLNILVQFGSSWGLNSLITMTPTYLKFIHKLHIRSTGIVSSLPHLTRVMLAYGFGIYAQKQTYFTNSGIRKLASAICTIVVSIPMIGLAYSGDCTVAAMFLLIVALTLLGTIPAGPMAALIDLSPNFSSVLQGISGTVSVLSGFFVPIVAGYLTKNNQTASQWQTFFLLSAVMCCITGFLYLIYGNIDLQWWNAGRKNRRELDAEEAKEAKEDKIPLKKK